MKRYGIILPKRRPYGLFRVYGQYYFFCTEQYDYCNRCGARSPRLHISEAKTFLFPVFHCPLPGHSVLDDLEYSRSGHITEAKASSRRGKAIPTVPADRSPGRFSSFTTDLRKVRSEPTIPLIGHLLKNLLGSFIAAPRGIHGPGGSVLIYNSEKTLPKGMLRGC